MVFVKLMNTFLPLHPFIPIVNCVDYSYTLGGTYPKVTDQSIMNDGHNTDLGLCEGFDANGNTRGLSATIKENLDYGNAFVGHVSNTISLCFSICIFILS